MQKQYIMPKIYCYEIRLKTHYSHKPHIREKYINIHIRIKYVSQTTSVLEDPEILNSNQLWQWQQSFDL